MNDAVPPWVADLADSGRMSRPPPNDDESAAASKLDRLMKAFGQILKPEVQAPENSEHVFTWGHLKATALIGQGGFGDVYRAFDTTLEREVALKLRHGDAAHARSFIAEARRLAQVRHPNVLAVYGAGVHEGRAGLWADLLDGQTVSETVGAQGALSWPATLDLARDLASALAAVHRAGLIHGDVKPSNIMLQADGHAVLMDFGAAAEHSTAARFGLLGSPLSMAPEQLRGEPVDVAADMYSLGVVIFFAACGRHPLEAATLAGLQSAHKNFDPAYALKDQSQLPRAFRHLLASWLDPDPKQRPDARASLLQIERVAGAPARRRKRIAVTAIIGSLILALIVSLFAIKRISAERHAAEIARTQQAAVSQFLEDTLAAPDPHNSGADVRVADVLDIAAEKAQSEFAEQPTVLLPLLRTIGNSYLGIGLNTKAEPVLAKALELSRGIDGLNSANSLELELKLAEVRDSQQQRTTQDSPKALEDLFNRARQSLGPGHRISVYAALQLVSWHRFRRQPQATRRYIDYVLAQRPAGGTLQPTQRATALFELANLEDRSGANDSAMEHFKEALQIALDVSDGRGDQGVYAIRNSMALMLREKGDLAGAEQQLRELLAMTEYFGEGHRNVRVTLLNLSAVLNTEHKYEEAETLMRRCIALSRKYDGDNHEIEFRAVSNLATMLAETGRLAEAAPIRERLRNDVIRALGADNPFAIMLTLNLAEQRILEGDGAAAQPLALETIERSERVLGIDHVYAIEGWELLARARFLRGEQATAMADMAKVCARKREILGEAQQYTLTCMSHRADMLAATGQRDKAITVLEQVLKLTEQQLGPDNPGTIDAREHLAAIKGKSSD